MWIAQFVRMLVILTDVGKTLWVGRIVPFRPSFIFQI